MKELTRIITAQITGVCREQEEPFLTREAIAEIVQEQLKADYEADDVLVTVQDFEMEVEG